jgi:DNA-binding IclR family transcriptional regulator
MSPLLSSRAPVTEGSSDADSFGYLTGNKATARVFEILSLFLGDPPTLGVTEISRALGMTKSMVSRGLATLVKHNYLVRDASGSRYQLGFAFAEFGVFLTSPDIHLLCRPTLTQLNELTGETVSLHIPVRDTAVCIDGIRGTGMVVRRLPLGEAQPLHVTPGARAILAHLPQNEIDAYLNRPLDIPLGSRRSIDEAREDIRSIRALGYAVNLGETVPRSVGTAIAFPFLDVNGEPHGAITIAGPVTQFSVLRRQELLPAMEALMADLRRASRLHMSLREPVPQQATPRPN